MTLDELIMQLASKNILVSVREGEMIVNAPKGVLDEEWIGILREQKPALIGYLSARRHGNISKFDSIKPAATRPSYVLSSSQRRLWLLSHLGDANVAYNMSGTYMLSGMLDRRALEDAVNKIIARHESLRTVFRENEQGELQQFILPIDASGLDIGYEDLRNDHDRRSKVNWLIDEGSARPFNLSSGPLIRAFIYRVDEAKWIFTYTLHHIISDGWSMDVLIDELLRLYAAAVKGVSEPLPPLRIQYKDYASWQQQQLMDGTYDDHKKYWLGVLDGELPVLDLPSDRARPAVRTYRGGAVRRVIAKQTAAAMKSLAQQGDATLFISLLTAVGILLYRYTGQTDLLIGTPVAGRDHSDLEDQIGCYLNTLVLRTKLQGASGYRELLKEVRQMSLEAYRHKELPFDELVDTLRLRTDMGRNLLFDVMVELRDRFMERKDGWDRLGNLRVEGYEEETTTYSKFDLTFFFTEAREGLALLIEFNADIFNEDRVARMGEHLENLLAAIAKNPDRPIDQLIYLGKKEREKVLYEFNDTAINYPATETVLSLFRHYANLEPDTIALTSRYTAVSYGELDRKAGRLAGFLADTYHIGKGDLVGILLDRSEAAIISILGIMMTGAAYVPIDPEYPVARKEYICKNTGLKVLITHTRYLDTLGYCEAVVMTESAFDDIVHSPAYHHGRYAPPGQNELVYVIYTSGSTGEPKGCAITHGNLYNYIRWSVDHFFSHMGRPSFGLFTSLSFDLTVTTVFCPLTTGGRLHLYEAGDALTDALLHSFGAGSGINSAKITPSHITLLDGMGLSSPDLSCVVVGGEEMSGKHVRILKTINPSVRIFNEYGPTEATVGTTIEELSEEGPFLIGKPLANMRIYILDDNDQPCPIGIPGNMYISGKGLSRGYLDEKLNKLKFFPNPFVEGDRMYKTGDWGRWQPDGRLEFIGRKDEQVKIRGYRIELGEIEKTLEKDPDVQTAVVLAKTDEEGGKNLIAFYIPAGNEQQPVNATGQATASIEAALRKQLPYYMIPQRLIPVDHIPLTRNGKVDKKALLHTHAADLSAGKPYLAPRTIFEKKLAPIWQEVLACDKVGIDDNFFDLGGHSLKAMRLMAKIRSAFNISLGLDILFLHPTIMALAEYLEMAEWAGTGTAQVELIGDEEKFLL
ncbi:amino acid adenylation domain-containing protein [Flavitalea sp. BT771]|uniref:non-ribosomal peptide synthetase n=1 Tax=Flavitalea sp. BT771 TaxID=3063329 RepID=UPI0026E11E08|nr:amino acid adenylation domain-containing protein [Flavitalea sp. BT771]MDO6434619.1 amino acid adenylation domain-containing protein [Flavitalea sp. BT771]MDV6223519.1 amino acid adenylation domain-containing protein [Flavitalea sp. BT771]